jgi:hypothetical protein
MKLLFVRKNCQVATRAVGRCFVLIQQQKIKIRSLATAQKPQTPYIPGEFDGLTKKKKNNKKEIINEVNMCARYT